MKREGRATWISGRLLLCALLLVFGTFGAAPLAHAAFTMPQNNLGLVGWWTMDRITGTTVVDSSGSGNNGAEVGGPVQVAGKIGQALSFNGTSQYVNVSAGANLQNTVWTYSVWIKGDHAPNTSVISQPLADGALYSNLQLDWDHTNSAFEQSCAFSNGGSWYSVKIQRALQANTWYNIACSYDGSTLKVYLNGVLNNSFSVSATPNTASGPLTVGANPTGGGSYFPGSIDDVRIYNRALTAAEVQTLYQSSLPAHIASSINTPDLANGLVGWWTFDGNDVSGTSVFDKSGSGNTGTMVNSPKLIAGQIGQALSFNGTNQYLSVPTNAGIPIGNSNYTISLWFKEPAVGGGQSFVGWGNYGTTNAVNAFRMADSVSCPSTGGAGVENYWWANDLIVCSSLVTANKWHLAVAEYDGTTRTIYLDGVHIGSDTPTGHNVPYSSNLTIGVDYGGDYNNGSIDDVRIYNRALSAAEVQSLYDLGKQSHIASTVNPSGLSAGLVGHWSFDGAHLTTTTAYDTSGQGNNGALVNSPKPTAGVIGQALSFNGSNQYLSVSPYPSVYNAFSVSTWVYPTSLSQGSYGGGTGGTLIDENQSGGGSGWDLGINSSEKVWYWPFGGGDKVSTGTVPLNRWTYVTVTYDGSLLRMYFNGVLDSAQSASAASGSGPFFRIGAESWITGYWKGKLDDMRVYNRALSASEVRQLYVLGH